MKEQLRIGVGGFIKRSHEENGITVIDESDLHEASVMAGSPFDEPLTDTEREIVDRELDRAYGKHPHTKAEE